MRHLLLIACLTCPAPASADPGPPPREVRLDRDGERLPDGAIARLGIRRFRDPGAERLFVDDSGKTVACIEASAVRWWNLETGRYFRGWAAPVRGVFFSENGRIAAWPTAGGIQVWDAWNDVRGRFLPLNGGGELRLIVISPDRRLAAAVLDPTGQTCRLHHWSLDTGRGDVIGDSDPRPVDMHFADGNRLLIVRSGTETATAWDLATKTGRWRLASYHTALDRHGRWLYSADSTNGRPGLYDAATGQLAPGTVPIPEDKSSCGVRELSPDGRTLLDLGDGVAFWDLFSAPPTEEGRLLFRRARYDSKAAAFTPDGRTIVAMRGPRLHVYDVMSGRRLTRAQPVWGHLQQVEFLSWSADSRRVLTGVVDPDRIVPDQDPITYTSWASGSGRYLGQPSTQDLEARYRHRALVFSRRRQFHVEPDGPLPRDTHGRALRERPGLTHTADRTLLACGRYPGEPAEPIPDDQRVPNCSGYVFPVRLESPTVVEAASGRPLFTLPVPHAGHLAFSPDNRLLAVIEPDGVHLYDVPTGRKRLVRKVPTYPRSDPDAPAGLGLSWSPDGTKLAVIELGGTVLVLDVAVPRRVQPLADGEIDHLWADLASPDAAVGWSAIFRLTEHPTEAMRLLKDRLKPVREPVGVQRLISDLGSDVFRTREAASRGLGVLGDAAGPAIRTALEQGAAGERRERLMTLAAALAEDRTPPPPDLRGLRTLALLQRLQTLAARAVIEEIATGHRSTRVTAQATRILERFKSQAAEQSSHRRVKPPRAQVQATRDELRVRHKPPVNRSKGR